MAILGVALTMFGSIATAAFFLGGIKAKVTNLDTTVPRIDARVRDLEQKMASLSTRSLWSRLRGKSNSD